ncbi:MAG: hypothetical protein LBC04_03315, partial [Holosporaceae bacterium]|nr:hypothetical protein [Holosporaceae bacterium]
MKKMLVLGLALIMTVGTVFAGGGRQGSTSGDTSAQTITLKVLAGQSTTDAGIEKMIDEAVAKKYPEIKLEWECVDWG